MSEDYECQMEDYDIICNNKFTGKKSIKDRVTIGYKAAGMKINKCDIYPDYVP